jgi:hypothetical protein
LVGGGGGVQLFAQSDQRIRQFVVLCRFGRQLLLQLSVLCVATAKKRGKGQFLEVKRVAKEYASVYPEAIDT